MQRFRLINEHLAALAIVLSGLLLAILQALGLLNLTRCGNLEVLLLMLLLLLLMMLGAMVLNGCSSVYRALLEHFDDKLLVLADVALAGLRAGQLILATLSSIDFARLSVQDSFRHDRLIVIAVRAAALILHRRQSSNTPILLVRSKAQMEIAGLRLSSIRLLRVEVRLLH